MALVNSRGEIVGSLEVSEVFPWDKETYLKSVYLTDRTDHPGGDMVLSGDAELSHLVGGRINVLPQATHPEFGERVKSPTAVRALLAEKGWDRVVFFSGGTDGTDGPTDAAGAVADGETIERADAKGLAAMTFLKNNDAYHFFKPLNDLVMTGPTGTNVADVALILVGEPT